MKTAGPTHPRFILCDQAPKKPGETGLVVSSIYLHPLNNVPFFPEVLILY